MTFRVIAAVLAACSLAACASPEASTAESSAAETSATPLATTTEAFDLTAKDGVVLQGKIDLPTGPVPSGGWPVVLMLEGSGATDVDFTMLVPPTKPEDCVGARPDGTRPDGTSVKCFKVDQLNATRGAALGLVVVRLGKRGVVIDAQNPFLVHTDMTVHGTSTLSNRVSDVAELVTRLASDARFDTSRVYLWGVSEGTAVSSLFASQHPDRVGGLILAGPVLESIKDLYRFQAATVQFDQLLAVADKDGDRRVSKAEYASANLYASPADFSYTDPVFRDVLKTYANLGRPATFETFDTNGDGSIDRVEMDDRLDQDVWLPLLDAVAQGNAERAALFDDSNSVAQLREDFATPSIAPKLFALDCPISIIVGKRDLNTPAAQLDWFVPAAAAAGRTNITTTVIENTFGPLGPTGHHYGPVHVDKALARMTELHWPKR
jgi:pimeloyl-ACP methyl ester carboxylesterase